jgi:serine/threonine-protein kinase
VSARQAKPGDVLDGRFRLIEELGRGAMSTIYKAHDLEHGCRAVAVKLPLPIFANGLGAKSLFQQEEAIGRRLDHPYLLRFVSLPADKRHAYVVTEYVPGRTLADHLAQWGALPEPEALLIARRVCEALAHVHARGFVHYDVKPANVMLCPDDSIRIIDYGSAHAVASSRLTLVGPPPAIGSAGYVAPEQSRPRSGRTSVDVYGVGALLYEMLTGKPPFRDDDPFSVDGELLVGDPPAPRALEPSISPFAEEIVFRALRRNSGERYASITAMKHDLDHPELILLSRLHTRLRPATMWRKRWLRIRYIAFVAIGPLVAQVIVFMFLWQHLAGKHR